MARSSLKEPRSAPRDNREPHAPVHEFTGLLLLAGGLILFLALISYTPADLPDWLPFRNASARAASSHSLNYLGIFGALVAFAFYSLLGSAAYLLCAVLLGYGSAKLILPGTRLTRRSLWSLAFMVSGACLAHLLDLPLIEARRLALDSEGGLLGKWIGGSLLREILGSVGALAALFLIYTLSLLSMTGIHARDVLQALIKVPPKILESFQLWQKRRAEDRALRQTELEISADTPSRPAPVQPARNERKRTLKSPVQEAPLDEENVPKSIEPARPEPSLAPDPKDFAPVAESTPESSPEPVRPAPKIIDGTAPPPKKSKDPKREGDALSILENLSCEGYQLPSIDLLDPMDESSRENVDPAELHALQNVIIETLQQFGIEVSPGDITRGPTITRYEVYPAKGVRVDRILALERDLARATRAERINILAPIPGKDTVGIEIANAKKQKVTLRELFESEDFSSNKAKIPIALGKDVYGKTIVADLAAMPHGLVAGTTGSGKSVCINAIIASILYRFTPEQLRFIMIDPKVVEMQMYNTLPHLVVPVVTDPKKVLLALRWAVDEMEKRYAIFAKTGVRNIASFNARPKLKSQKELDAERKARQPELFDESLQPAALLRRETESEEAAGGSIGDASPALRSAAGLDSPEVVYEPPLSSTVSDSSHPETPLGEVASTNSESAREDEASRAGEPDPESLTAEERIEKMTTIRVPRDTDLRIPERMSYIVIIVDELADLMQTAPADVEGAIARITQKARAAGIHMIIATQTPRADVITGVIKANVPCRVAFQVASALDSRVILDENGAEKLLGQGDMLYRPPGTSRMVRAQGVLVTDDEVRRLVDFASAQGDPQFENSIQSRLQGEGDGESEEVSDEDEDLVDKCIEVMRQEKKASTSLFQRRLRLGYTRAARILDILESRGYVGPGEGAKPREILVDLDTL